ncbi:hypothetical protein GCM10010319_24930 [Streptomyces blastmyceticus]|uniref:Uncharacterized protein n=1 Tax=Streptomyces blastmyceticus TaxID=68180 RepID=A0ABP3GN63_9ACTN
MRCEPAAAELEDVRFLAGYRRGWLFDEELLAEIRGADLYGDIAERGIPRVPAGKCGMLCPQLPSHPDVPPT